MVRLRPSIARLQVWKWSVSLQDKWAYICLSKLQQAFFSICCFVFSHPAFFIAKRIESNSNQLLEGASEHTHTHKRQANKHTTVDQANWSIREQCPELKIKVFLTVRLEKVNVGGCHSNCAPGAYFRLLSLFNSIINTPTTATDAVVVVVATNSSSSRRQ